MRNEHNLRDEKKMKTKLEMNVTLYFVLYSVRSISHLIRAERDRESTAAASSDNSSHTYSVLTIRVRASHTCSNRILYLKCFLFRWNFGMRAAEPGQTADGAASCTARSKLVN